MKKLLCIIAVTLLAFLNTAQTFAAENEVTKNIRSEEMAEIKATVKSLLKEAKKYDRDYRKNGDLQSFYKAKNRYEAVLEKDALSRETYVKLIELLLAAKDGLPLQVGFLVSPVVLEDEEGIQRVYRKNHVYMAYGKNSYRQVENPLLAIDILVNRAASIFKGDPIEYDKKWLSQKYVALSEALLSQRPDNPSLELDKAIIFADRALDLSPGSQEAKNIRNTFRQRR